MNGESFLRGLWADVDKNVLKRGDGGTWGAQAGSLVGEWRGGER